MSSDPFLRIWDGCEEGRYILRISDRSSHSPFLKHDRRNAFLATSALFDSAMSNATWREYQNMWDDWTDLEAHHVREIVRHVAHGYSTQSYSQASIWVSGTTRIGWAVWEISRRLVRQLQPVVQLSVIHRTYSPRYRGTKHFVIEPNEVISHWVKKRGLSSMCSRDTINRALNFSATSREVLFLGRIFEKERWDTTTWTAAAEGLDLPEYFYQPKKYWNAGDDWLDKLIWDPWVDSYSEAKEKIEARRAQLRASRR